MSKNRRQKDAFKSHDLEKETKVAINGSNRILDRRNWTTLEERYKKIEMEEKWKKNWVLNGFSMNPT